MPKKAAKLQGLGDVAETLDLQKKQEQERAKTYPMCAKLSRVRSDKAIIDCFLDWLYEDKKIELCTRSKRYLGENFAPIHASKDALLMEYFGIDQAELEKERRKILAEQRRANGDLDASEDD